MYRKNRCSCMRMEPQKKKDDNHSHTYNVPAHDLIGGLAEFYNNPALSDGEIHVNGKVFAIHRNILAAVSPYFRAMYMGSFKESTNEPTKIEGVSSEVVEIILEAIYKRKLKLTAKNVTEVMAGAHMMQISPLLDQCECFIQKHMNSKICLEYLKLAEMYNLSGDVLAAAENCFLTNFKKVSEDESFLELSIDALGKYLNSDIIHCREIEVFECTMKWLSHVPERKEHVKDLFQWIRLGLVSIEDLLLKINGHPLIVGDPFCHELIQKTILYKSNLYAQPLFCGIINKPRGKDVQLLTREYKWSTRIEDIPNSLHMRTENEFEFFFFDFEVRKPVLHEHIKTLFARRSTAIVANRYKNFFFIHGVDSRPFSNAMMRFDCGIHDWVSLSGIPQDPIIRYNLVMLGSKLLLVGGYVINKESRMNDKHESIRPRMSNSVWQYDIAANDWNKRNNFPHKVYNMGACVCDEELFVFGGCLEDESATDKMYKYNAEQDIWVRQTSMSVARKFPFKAYAETAEGFIVAGTGTGGQAVSEMYTVATDQWCDIKIPAEFSNVLTPQTGLFIGCAKGVLALFVNKIPKSLVFNPDSKSWEEQFTSLIPTGAASAMVCTGRSLKANATEANQSSQSSQSA